MATSSVALSPTELRLALDALLPEESSQDAPGWQFSMLDGSGDVKSPRRARPGSAAQTDKKAPRGWVEKQNARAHSGIGGGNIRNIQIQRF